MVETKINDYLHDLPVWSASCRIDWWPWCEYRPRAYSSGKDLEQRALPLLQIIDRDIKSDKFMLMVDCSITMVCNVYIESRTIKTELGEISAFKRSLNLMQFSAPCSEHSQAGLIKLTSWTNLDPLKSFLKHAFPSNNWLPALNSILDINCTLRLLWLGQHFRVGGGKETNVTCMQKSHRGIMKLNIVVCTWEFTCHGLQTSD